MSARYIGRILSMQTSLGLKAPQVAKLNELLKADDSLSTEAAKLESVGAEVNTLLRQKSLDAKKLEQLHTQSKALENKLHEDASRLNEQVKGILDPTQFSAVEKSLRSSDSQQSRLTTIGPQAQYPPPTSNTWAGTWTIHGNVPNGLTQNCITVWSAVSVGEGLAGLTGMLVPYCYKVDSSKGASGGYTLDVIDQQGVQGTTITPVIVRSPTNVYTIGFALQVTICSQPFWGATGWYDAAFTLYGIRICDNAV